MTVLIVGGGDVTAAGGADRSSLPSKFGTQAGSAVAVWWSSLGLGPRLEVLVSNFGLLLVFYRAFAHVGAWP